MHIRSLSFIAALILGGSPSFGATLKVGAEELYKVPSAAAAVVRDGDRIAINPGTYFDCAVWRANDLVIEGTGPGVVITDTTCMGKGIFVIVGNNTTVRNLTLARARVPDMNGAGIRLDHGNLVVDSVRFLANQNGILGGEAGSTVIIRNSDFVENGYCDQACSHGIYIGDVTLLRVENSRFFRTRQGHAIKSRARRTEVLNNDISDGPDGTSSYLLDVPNGGALVVMDNKFEKGPNSGNHTAAIAIGEEGINRETPEIKVIDNVFRNDGSYSTAFVWNVTATPAILKNNRIFGSATPLRGDGRAE